jgi:predicted acylesterase/phospholipase RssA
MNASLARRTHPRPLLKLALASVLAASTLGGCATPKRLPAVPDAEVTQAQPLAGPIRFLVTRDTEAMAAEASRALEREKAWLAANGQTGPLPPAAMLAISGGGDNGAFGAGLLNGWTAAGARPQFKAVTGISTGALIAPFAFLGPAYDPVLKSVYTEVSQSDIFKPRGLLKGIFGDAMADTTPLSRIVQKQVDQHLLDAIAAEYAKGRLLLVGTTNIDTLEPVVWNMTAIAASKDPRAIVLFRKVLLASAAIPAAFPPVLIDVEVGGKHYQEMHVDGGTLTQVFAYPPSIRVGDLQPRQRVLYIIRNARLDVDWADTKRRTLPIAMRAVSGLMQSQGVGDLYRIFVSTQRDGVDFNLAFIPPTFDTPHVKDFDQTYMRALYQTGYDMAAKGYPWGKEPPGYSSPFTEQVASPKPAPDQGVAR